MERSARIHLVKRKVFMATIVGYVKTPQANFAYKGVYFVRQFENVCIPPCLDVMVLGSTRNNASASRTKLNKLNFVVFDFTQ